MSIYQEIISYLNDMKIANTTRFFPYYICSGGAHLFNRFNKANHIYVSHGLPIDLRMHIFFVSQPGFSKTFTMRTYSDPVFGIFSNTEINPAWEDRMTEARFSGTVYANGKGEVITQKGAAFEYRNCVLCVDEFDALAKTMKMAHSSTFESAICTALDSGWVRKGMARGKLDYKTDVTVWAGSQPARYDLGQGTGRRFVFLEFIPSESDEDEIRKAMRNGRNIRPDRDRLSYIREQVRELWTNINLITGIEFDKSIDDMYDELRIMPYEEHLFNVISIGYTLMKKDFDRTLTVECDKELERLLRMEDEWRSDIKKGPETSQVLQIMRDKMEKLEIEWVPKLEIQERMSQFGTNYAKSNELIYQLIREGRVQKETKESHIGKREDCVRII